MFWHVAPEDQGQIVEYAYASDPHDRVVFRRITDRSDLSVWYAYTYLDEIENFAPWTGARNLRDPNLEWREISWREFEFWQEQR